MRERRWGPERERGEETKCACVIFLNLCKYQLHGSRVTKLEMKQVEVQIKKWGGKLNKLDGQEKKTTLARIEGEISEWVGSVGRWEEML